MQCRVQGVQWSTECSAGCKVGCSTGCAVHCVQESAVQGATQSAVETTVQCRVQGVQRSAECSAVQTEAQGVVHGTAQEAPRSLNVPSRTRTLGTRPGVAWHGQPCSIDRMSVRRSHSKQRLCVSLEPSMRCDFIVFQKLSKALLFGVTPASRVISTLHWTVV